MLIFPFEVYYYLLIFSLLHNMICSCGIPFVLEKIDFLLSGLKFNTYP